MTGMARGRRLALGLATLIWLLAVVPADAQKGKKEPEGLIGKIDLMTTKGVEAVKGEWRYHEVTTGVGPKKNEIEPAGRHDLKGVGKVFGFPGGNCRKKVAYNEKGCQPYDGMVFNE